MIHYTLLPEREIRILKKEYRTRLIIITFFFVSFGILIGIAALFPAYILSSVQEKDSINSLKVIENNRKSKGVESILKELNSTSEIVKKIKSNQSSLVSSDIISNIISSKTADIQLSSFQFSTVNDSTKNATTSTSQLVIQGKSANREGLIKFKNTLESNSLFSKVELPVSDLTKSKEIPFSLRLTIILPK